MLLTPLVADEFREQVWTYYHDHARSDLPWRNNTDAYAILVSELMLQQTQVARVIPKFNHFLKLFPDVRTLATAPLADALVAWSGLGYNRRAKFLHQSACIITHKYAGVVPTTQRRLEALPGIGPNTAGAIMAYAYNQPAIFVETNIRSVYFHHFYKDSAELKSVPDAEIRDLLSQTLDLDSPREWYWALMDYGTYLKGQTGGYLRLSRHYAKQSVFKGSLREMRGKILKILNEGPMYEVDLALTSGREDARFPVALQALVGEGLVVRAGGLISLTDSYSTSHNDKT